jgi:hypothetical protein
LHQEGSHLRFNNRLLAAAVGVALALPSIDAADATPVNDTFSVTATSGPLAGTTALGTFSDDTSSIVLGGININNGLLTALNFTWDGITYSRTNANTWALYFDATGMLTGSLFGTNCTVGCGVGSRHEQWDIYVRFGFTYAVQGVVGVFSGTITESLVVATAEPSSLALVGVAVAGLTLAGFGAGGARPDYLRGRHRRAGSARDVEAEVEDRGAVGDPA